MIFCMEISIKVFYKLVVSFLLVIARHAQNTQNSKFVISLQYLKKEGKDEIDFLHADKYQTILQVDTINLGGHGQPLPARITQNNKFAKTLQYLKKEVRDEIDFLWNEYAVSLQYLKNELSYDADFQS